MDDTPSNESTPAVNWEPQAVLSEAESAAVGQTPYGAPVSDPAPAVAVPSVPPALRRRELAAVLGVLVALLCMAYGNVIFAGRSLVFTDNYNPLDYRPLAQNYGPGLVPSGAWTSRNLLPYANFHDPGCAWWQWEPGGEFLRRALARGEWPWWDPYVGAGTPAMANLTQAFFFPPYLVLVALGNTPALKNVYFLALLLMAAASSYALLRKHGTSREAALGAGIAVLLCGGLNQNVGSFIGQAAACLPLALLLTRYTLERPSWRRTALLAVGYGAMALASFPPVLLAVFGTSAVYALVLSLGHQEPWRRLARYGVAAGLALGLVAFAYAPVFAIMIEALPQFERHYDGAALTTVPWVALSQLLSPVLMGGNRVLADPPMPSLAGGFTQSYVGVVVLLLAGLAAAEGRRDQRLFFGVLAGGVVVVAAKLVGIQPVHSLARLPGLDHIHFGYFSIPLGMLLALGAGLGLDRLVRGTVSRRHLAAMAGGLGLVVLALPMAALVRGALKHPLAASWLLRWYLLLALLVAAVGLALPLCRGAALSPRVRRLCVAGLLALLAAEGIGNTAYPRQNRWNVWQHPPPYVEQLIAHRHAGRIFSASALPANAGSAFELYQLDSLMAFNPPRVFELYARYAAARADLFLREADSLPPERVLDAANVALLVVREVRQPLLIDAQRRGGYRELFQDGYVRVLARDTEPRYYFTSSYRLTTAEGALAELPARRPREVLLERSPAFDAQPNAAGDPTVTARTLRNRVVLRLRAPRSGLVYCSETLASGWRAEVNGKSVPILAANYAFRAVPVPPGEVVVTLSYFPPGLRFGLLISLVALLGTIALALIRERLQVAGLEARGGGFSPRISRMLVGLGAAALLAGALTQAAHRDRPTAVAPAGKPVIPVQPPSFYRIEWGGVELPPTLTAGRHTWLLVSFKNAGTETWPDPQMADPVTRNAGGAVRLSYRWLDEQGQVVSDYQSRSDLPRPLRSGESITLPVEAALPAAAGRYRLQVDLVHELVDWFETRGAARFELTVTVQPAPE
jgi:hypothetical protein